MKRKIRAFRAGQSRWYLCLTLLATACTDDAAPTSKTVQTPAPPAARPTDDGPPPPPAFAVVPEAVYVAKVKNLLTGLPPTDAEVLAVKQADPAAPALPGLIDQWMQRPEFQTKMIGFFRNAFQQNQVSATNLEDLLNIGIPGDYRYRAKLAQNVIDSFPRTVWQLVAEGRPFNEALTTRRFMLTPPLAMLLAFADIRSYNDNGGFSDRLYDEWRTNGKMFSFTVSPNGPAIPLAESLDPSSPNYLHWSVNYTYPAGTPAECKTDQVYTGNTANLYDFLVGQVDNVGKCPNAYYVGAQTDLSEFDNWRMVSIRRPELGETTSRFYDIQALRNSSEMVLRIPRVGFFSTLGFFANWQTNSSNQARVTMNQTLIVALGKSFDDTNTTVPVSEPALNSEHASPGTVCYACHRSLDPMRQIFRQAYSLSYHEQTDPAQSYVHGVFAFGDVSKPIANVYELGDALAQNPRFATAWTQKLCYFANSAACAADDPEFLRVADVFQKSNFNFKVLLRELLSSPLTTGARATKTSSDKGAMVSITRRDHLCAQLSGRLGIADLCNLAGSPNPTGLQQRVVSLAQLIPADGYGRGGEAAIVSTDPNLFFHSATEDICRVLADQVVDAGASPRYSSKQPAPAMDDMIANVMGLTKSDPRAAGARQILDGHYKICTMNGATLVDALKSTFVLACMAPSSVGVGM